MKTTKAICSILVCVTGIAGNVHGSPQLPIPAHNGTLTVSPGDSLALSGDAAFVGRPARNGGDGSCDIYEFNSATQSWGLKQTLAPPLTGILGEFGFSVAARPGLIGTVSISPRTTFLVVGAPGEWANNPLGQQSGRVHVYSRNNLPTASWTLVQSLDPGTAENNDRFGAAVGICQDGQTIIVGAPGDDDALYAGQGSNPGAIYVFSQDMNGVWTQVDKLTGADTAIGDQFGHRLACFEDQLIVSSFRGGSNTGSVYLFQDSPPFGFVQEASFLGFSGGGIGVVPLGASLDIGPDIAIASKVNETRLFRRSGGVWESSVLIPGMGGAVAALKDGSAVYAAGATSIFEYSPTGVQTGILDSSTGAEQQMAAAHSRVLTDSGLVHSIPVINENPTGQAVSFCFCDAFSVCGNNAHAGCTNLSGGSGLLSATGTLSATADDLTLIASNLNPGLPGLFFVGTQPRNKNVLGAGLRCVGGPPGGVFRFPPQIAANGIVQVENAFSATDTVIGTVPILGVSYYYQYWYRDPSSPCPPFPASDSNLTSALSVIFVP
jgi:hypothetical protein